MNNTVWTIGGFDTCSGAGVTADLKTLQDFFIHGCAVVSLLTAQNAQEILAVNTITMDFFKKQIETFDLLSQLY